MFFLFSHRSPFSFFVFLRRIFSHVGQRGVGRFPHCSKLCAPLFEGRLTCGRGGDYRGGGGGGGGRGGSGGVENWSGSGLCKRLAFENPTVPGVHGLIERGLADQQGSVDADIDRGVHLQCELTCESGVVSILNRFVSSGARVFRKI